jgi:hypothetical protein
MHILNTYMVQLFDYEFLVIFHACCMSAIFFTIVFLIGIITKFYEYNIFSIFLTLHNYLLGGKRDYNKK